MTGSVPKRPRGRPRSAETSGAMALQSADRVLAVLQLFTDERPDLRVGEVAQGLGVSESTASRLLALLETRGYVGRDPSTGMYALGAQVLTQAGVAMNRSTLRRAGLEEMARLVNSLGLGTNLAVLHRGAVFYLGNLDGRHAPRYYTLLGRHYPVHATALGKVLLAWHEASEVDTILAGHAGFAAAYLSQRKAVPQPGELRRYTASTIGTTDAFHACLALVRRQGYSTEREELAMGRACVAAPIRGRHGAVIAGLSISGPERIVDLPGREGELAAAAVDAAMRISERLGFVLPPAGECVEPAAPAAPPPAAPVVAPARSRAATKGSTSLAQESVWDQSAP
jgi:DNA-binding IclR family transcriptional regulator